MKRYELAKIMKVDPTMVTKWEKQQNQPRCSSRWKKLAKALKTTEKELFYFK
jgi:ribosome-binding protein aMBF1 (putative translation factor)